MRIDASLSTASLAREAKPTQAREVQPKRTPLKPSEIRKAISSAWQKLHGTPIAQKTLDILSAQVSNETALGSSMYNYNFGGIKGASPEGLTARCGTREVLGGEEKHIVDGFRAYGSATQGATDYVAFLEKKYPKAVESAEKGDVDGFVAHLKAGHYFTADAAQYTANVKGLLAVDDNAALSRGSSNANQISPLTNVSSAGAFSGTEASPFATSATLARVFDAMSISAASIAAPLSDEDDALKRL